MRILMLPLLALSALAVYVSGNGAAVWWSGRLGAAPHLACALAASAALHAAWLVCAARRRAPLLAAGFLASLWFSRHGLAALRPSEPPMAAAVLIEALPLLIAFAMTNPKSWAERLSGWRRARADIILQLQMSDGILPWFRKALTQFIGGAAQIPVSPTFQRLTAGLAGVESRLAVRVASLAAPEQLRQFVLSSAAGLLAQAEQASQALAIDLERRTLALAAACREQCDLLTGVAPADRQRLARQCEELLFDLVRHAGAKSALAAQL